MNEPIKKLSVGAVILVLAAACGLMIGLASRAVLKKSAQADQTREQQPLVKSEEKPVTRFQQWAGRDEVKDDSPLATQLARDLSMSTGVTRWLHWFDALEKASPHDFPRLAMLARGDVATLRLLGTRWVDQDPKHLFDTLVAASRGNRAFPFDRLSEILLREWPKRDPQAIVTAMNQAKDFPARFNWHSRIASAVLEQDPELGLRVFSEWHIENFGPRMTAVAKWAEANPRHAAEFALAHPAGFASKMAMETIGQEWVKSDPVAAMNFAASQRGELQSLLANSALKSWAEKDLTAAADWLVSTDRRTRERLSPHFVEGWATKDTIGALNWCEENLNGNALAKAVGGVFKGAVEKELPAAASLVAQMEPSPAREQGAMVVGEKWLPNWSNTTPTKAAPEALEWLATLDPKAIKAVLDRVQWFWASADPSGMAKFVASVAGDDLPMDGLHALLRSYTRQSPVEAMEWANTLPGKNRISVGSQAFNAWREAQLEPAMNWWRKLPSTDPRRVAFFDQTIRNMAFDPRGREQLAALPQSEQSMALEIIQKIELPEETRRRLLNELAPRK